MGDVQHQLALAPPHTIRAFRGPEDTIRTMVGLVKGQRGEHSVYLRSLTEQVTRGLQPKDYFSEIIAVRNFCTERIRYMNDPLTLELVKDPQRLAEEIVAKGKAVGDCLPVGTRLLAQVSNGAATMPIEGVAVGSKIWGLGGWTTVQAIVSKGVMPVDRVRVSHDFSFLATNGHKVYVQKCKRHDEACDCPLAERTEARIRISDLRAGMALTQPTHLPTHNGVAQAVSGAAVTHVQQIEHAVAELPCWDIQTEDHRVYLPAADVTVSNCDDIAALSAAMLRQLGRNAQFVTVGFGKPGHYSHVFTRVQEPKSQKWFVCDPVAGTDEGTMLRRVKTYRFWTID